MCTYVDTFIATHSDDEHIGGAAQGIGNYGVTKVVDSGLTHENDEIGDDLSENSEVAVEVLFVDPPVSTLDDESIVLKVTRGENTYLLTGADGYRVEDQLMKAGVPVRAYVLKVTHQGASTATSAEFLAAADPVFAILSVGKTPANYPHEEVAERIRSLSSAYICTDDRTITFVDDGKEYEI